MGNGAGSLLLFLFLGLAGSAGPAHVGFRVLARAHQRDKGLDFAEGTDEGGWGYSWWLMRWRHRAAGDRALDFFGGIAAVAGWLALVGATGALVMITLQ